MQGQIQYIYPRYSVFLMSTLIVPFPKILNGVGRVAGERERKQPKNGIFIQTCGNPELHHKHVESIGVIEVRG